MWFCFLFLYHHVRLYVHMQQRDSTLNTIKGERRSRRNSKISLLLAYAATNTIEGLASVLFFLTTFSLSFECFLLVSLLRFFWFLLCHTLSCSLCCFIFKVQWAKQGSCLTKQSTISFVCLAIKAFDSSSLERRTADKKIYVQTPRGSQSSNDLGNEGRIKRQTQPVSLDFSCYSFARYSLLLYFRLNWKTHEIWTHGLSGAVYMWESSFGPLFPTLFSM